MKPANARPLQVVHVELKDANEFVALLHRHHKPCTGHRFSIGVQDPVTGKLHGVAIVGRPVARMIDQRNTVEVNRLCTDGTPNACSMLYAAAAAAAKALGYRRIITYILDSEPGTSLKAVGWNDEGLAGGGEWGNEKRPRVTERPEPKRRWARDLVPVGKAP
jgi:hypothetical protein